MVQAGLATRTSSHNAWSQTFELGASAGAFLGGGLGTSPLFAAHLDWRFVARPLAPALSTCLRQKLLAWRFDDEPLPSDLDLLVTFVLAAGRG